LPAQLDSVDLEENTVFPITITYGTSADAEYQTLFATPQFKTASSGILTYIVVGLIIIVFIIIIMRRKNRGNHQMQAHLHHPNHLQ